MPLLTIPPEEADSSSMQLVLGRALLVASSFEHDCRCLTLVLKLKEPRSSTQSDEEAFQDFTKAVLGRLAQLNDLIALRAKLSKDYATLLSAAREARNYVAHEASNEYSNLKRRSGGCQQWRDIVASKIEDIAYGKIIVAVLLSRNSAEITPTQETINAYPAEITAWVLKSNA